MPPSLSIIGCGNLGRTLGRLWHTHRVLTVFQILNRSEESARQAAEFIGAGDAIASYAALRHADFYLIAAPDDQIAECARQLAATRLLTPQSIVFHCSGSLPANIMQDVQACGAAAASVHPIRSFAVPEQVVESFQGTWCGMEGTTSALSALDRLFHAVGAQTVVIDPSAKMLYHAAAVFASNYLVTLADVALEAYAQAGISKDIGLQMIAPLMRKTAENLLAMGPERALSGPVARGDWKTVEAQYRAIESWNSECASLYKQLALRTEILAKRRKQDAE